MSTASKEPASRTRSNAGRAAAKGTAAKPKAKPSDKPARAARSLKPATIPRIVRAAAPLLAAAGDPVRLEMLDALAVGEGVSVEMDVLASRFGLDAAVIADHLVPLRKLGWVEAVRSPAGWNYRTTARGVMARFRALEFAREG